MKPATDRQTTELFFLEPTEQPEFNVTRVDVRELQTDWNCAAAQNGWSQNTTSQD